MPPEPTILAFDTSAAHCAAALLRGGAPPLVRVEEMGRGQSERLVPMLNEMLSEAGLAWADLDAIGVGIGPGNFTGIRIAVATARGLALALDAPAIGVSGFDAACPDPSAHPFVLVAAPRGQVYAARAHTETSPVLIAAEEAADLGGPVIRADEIPLSDRIVTLARHAAARHSRPAPRPAPLYVRPADALPSSDKPPVILP